MNKIGRDFVGAKKKIKVECKEISYNWLLSSKETAWTRKRNRTPMSSSFIIPCAISNRVRLSNRLWLSLKARHLSYHMALNSQKEVRNKRVHERLMSYAMKHGRCSFSWLSFTKEKKKVLRWTQVVPSIPSVDPGPLYGEKSLLCSDFV